MFYYKVDLLETINGSGVAPFFVLALINRLPDSSKFMASLMGGDEWFGWGQDRALYADLYDAIARLTEVTIGKHGGKAPKLERWPRPKRADKTKKSSRLLELHAMFASHSGAKK
jgi:hypothetical protein